MAKQPRKPSPRLSVPPPGALGFAGGGKIDPEELMRQMSAKYGAPAAGPVTQPPAAQPSEPPVQQPKPQHGPGSGIVGVLKGRAAQIDEAERKAVGYKNGKSPDGRQFGAAMASLGITLGQGGKIEGPGTPTSDDINATVRETGEPIKVSTTERIVSAEQDKFLEGVAKAAGYESLDAMLEDGTGRPVGPVVRSGKRAAADGMAPDDRDPFAYRGAHVSNPRVDAAIAAPPTLGAAPLARSEPAGTLTNPVASGITIDPFGPKPERLGSGLAGIGPVIAPGQSGNKPGRDASGLITAESASAATGNDMQRSGGISGGIDMAGVNGIMARENKARGEMIDLSIAANGGNGIGVLGADGNGMTQTDRDNAEKTTRWRQDDLIDKASRGNQGVVSTAIHANATGDAEARRNEIAIRGQDLGYGARMAAQGLTARGQDLGLQRAQERNDVLTRGQDVRAGTAADRTASNEAIAAARITERSGPSLGQQRGNAEIDAARSRVSGMDAAEIKRRTANYTATGRENPDYDPTLAKAVTLANRRKVGTDDEFDQRQPADQAAGNDGDVMVRFRGDAGMKGHKTGQMTALGLEVFDSTGMLIGHYR